MTEEEWQELDDLKAEVSALRVCVGALFALHTFQLDYQRAVDVIPRLVEYLKERAPKEGLVPPDSSVACHVFEEIIEGFEQKKFADHIRAIFDDSSA